jgi:hypothetical protein
MQPQSQLTPFPRCCSDESETWPQTLRRDCAFFVVATVLIVALTVLEVHAVAAKQCTGNAQRTT